MPKAASRHSLAGRGEPAGGARSWRIGDRPSARRWLIGSVVGVGLGLVFAAASDALSVSDAFFDENGPIESLQALLLAVTTLVFCWSAWRSTDSKAFFSLCMAGASFVATLREVPRCGGPYAAGDLCVPQTDKDIALAIVGLAILLVMGFSRWNWRDVLDLRNLRYVWITGLSALTLALAEIAERVHLPRVEESVELVAYALLAIVALRLVARIRD
ncbi:hypothetical protein GCM10011390_07100 [Aureimonas endophytica]|uniref:Uncharacterized protein n=1 Tax=Aureimonas endophytica TaxID=2027858 RepID=A0A916ZEW4_9HYPH|nr:hypothetical protein [Aureimonas endophytica]GGD90988.1 hypothetical protein GCM10011390_07100 [Aureimonas endophytica]